MGIINFQCSFNVLAGDIFNTIMTNLATSLSIVKELKRLASIQTNRQYMLRNDVNSLLIFVDPDEQHPTVIIESLHALRYLAQEAVRSESTLTRFQNTVGLQALLGKITNRHGFDEDCKKVASDVLLLSKCNPTRHATKEQQSSGVITRAGMRANRKTNQKEPVKFLGGNKKAKIIQLQIEGLEGEARKKECITELLRVTGVISITFNMGVQRCTIRARADMHAESLVHAIQNTRKMKAKQVVKNENGEEVFVSFDDMDDLPPYLEEDAGDSPNKEENKQSVARPGYTEAVGSFARSWFGGVVNAVNKNLYW